MIGRFAWGSAYEAFQAAAFPITLTAAVARRADVANGTPHRYPDEGSSARGFVRQEIAEALVDVNAANRAPGEKVGTFLRRTMVPAMRIVERQVRGAIARLVLTEGVRFPALVEIYRREMFDPLLEQLCELLGSASQSGELKTDALADYPGRASGRDHSQRPAQSKTSGHVSTAAGLTLG